MTGGCRCLTLVSVVDDDEAICSWMSRPRHTSPADMINICHSACVSHSWFVEKRIVVAPDDPMIYSQIATLHPHRNRFC